MLPSLPPLQPSQRNEATAAANNGTDDTAAVIDRVSDGIITQPIRNFAHNLSRTKAAVVTDTAVYLFHFQEGESMCVGVWRRSPDSLLSEGPNGWALFSSDDQAIAVTTTRNVLNVLRVREIHQKQSNGTNGSASNATLPLTRQQASPSSVQVCSFPDAEWHDEVSLNAPIFHPIHLQLQSRVKLANDYITCACVFGQEMLLGTRGGYIQVVSWDGQAKICVDALAWATIASSSRTSSSSQPTTPQSPNKPSVTQVATTLTLGLVAFVFSDGSAGLCDTSLLRPTSSGHAPLVQPGSGVLIMHGQRPDQHATRVAFNSRYRLLAIGLENGDVSVYRVEAQSRLESHQTPIKFSYLRRYSIEAWGFTPQDVGSVNCMEWSPDGSVLAVGWSNRGLVMWSTGGTRVACTLPMLSSIPATLSSHSANHSPSKTHQSKLAGSSVTAAHATPGQLHPLPAATSNSSSTITHSSSSIAPPTELLGNGVAALAWGCSGASLLVSGHCDELAHGYGCVRLKSQAWSDVDDSSSSSAANGGASPGTRSSFPTAEARCGCGLVTRLALVRSALGVNPSQNEATSLALLGDDRLVLWSGKRSVAAAAEDEPSSDELLAAGAEQELEGSKRKRLSSVGHSERFLESDGDWEHIQLPAVYLSHAWPVQLCALSASGNQIACAGAQGLICFNRLASERKWRRFGNVLHEAQVQAAGLAWYGEHIVCVASRGIQSAHQPAGRTSQWSPPPAASGQSFQSVGPNDTQHPDQVELLFFPRNHLDNASLLHTHVLSNARSFHSIDISDHTLMVYLSVGQLLVYHLRAEVHQLPGARKVAGNAQQQMLAMLGVGSVNGRGAQPYSTLPWAHEGLSLDHELRMAMELAYVVDLCAPLKPVRSIGTSSSTYEQEELSSLQPMLSSPPLQVRLWLSSADSGEDDSEAPPPAAATESDSTNANGSTEQVYSLPLFCPNVVSHGLEALHHATQARKNTSSVPSDDSTDPSTQRAGTVLSCMLLSATGTLIAVDIGAARACDGPLSPLSPSTHSPNSSHGQSHMRAWARLVATDVEQFWLHEMAAPDPTQAALQYLMPMKQLDGSGASSTGLPLHVSTLHPSPSFSSLSRKRLRGLRLFSYGSHGLDVWFRLGTSGGMDVPPSFESTHLLEFDPEVYPLGFDSTIGVIVGITKGLRTKPFGQASASLFSPTGATLPSHSNHTPGAGEEASSPFWGPVVCFRLQTKLQPYLHGVLMHLVANEPGVEEHQLGEFAYAYEIANSCRSHSYFPVSLELLLHTALNPSSGVDHDRVLGRVVSFLRRFAEFPDLVMNVARKNDSSCWSRLFERAGTPTQLFQLCLERGKLRMASCYLLVIQRTEGMIVARDHAKMVLHRIDAEEQAANARLNGVANIHTVAAPSTSSSSNDSIAPPISSSPGLSSSPSVIFRRRRRLSALESELQRFIVLTIGMEEEMLAQRALAVAEEAARGEAERRKREAEASRSWLPGPHTAVAPSQSTPIVESRTISAKDWSNPTAPIPTSGTATGTAPRGAANAPVVLFSPQEGVTPYQPPPPPQQQVSQEDADDGTNGGCRVM